MGIGELWYAVAGEVGGPTGRGSQTQFGESYWAMRVARDLGPPAGFGRQHRQDPSKTTAPPLRDGQGQGAEPLRNVPIQLPQLGDACEPNAALRA